MKDPPTQTKTPDAVRQKTPVIPMPLASPLSSIHPVLQLQRAVGNQAVPTFLSPVTPAPLTSAGPEIPPAAKIAVEIHWNEYIPWLFTVQGSPSASAISQELYGFDITEKDPAALKPFMVLNNVVRIAEPELLLPNYRDRFHTEMSKQLTHDAQRLEALIFDDTGTDEGLEILSTWAHRARFRTQGGRTYFDTLLARLRANYWYRDYWVRTGAKHTYFESLFDWAGSRAGEVSALIAQNSLEFGAYRPTWLYAEAAIGPRLPGGKVPAPVVNRELVVRSADLILEKLKGRTSASDSHVIADTLTGMPGPEQSNVLNEIMRRYDERNWIGLGRYGEASEGNMLYWLFEDLTSDDRDRLSASLVKNGIFSEAQAATLVEGRGRISRVLPWTTGKIGQLAEERVKYWADKAVNEDSKIAWLWGSVDALFLPQNIDATVMTILGAKLPGAIANVSRVAGAGFAVLGAGYMGYESGINMQKLISQKDPYTGKQLDTGELLASAFSLGSNILFMTAGGMEMSRSEVKLDWLGRPMGDIQSPVPNVAAPLSEELVAPTARSISSSAPQATKPIEWRVLNFDSNTGDISAIGRSGDDYVVVRINSRTMDGEFIHPRTGRILQVRGGIPSEAPQLPAAAEPTTPPPAPQLPAAAEPTTPPPAAEPLEERVTFGALDEHGRATYVVGEVHPTDLHTGSATGQTYPPGFGPGEVSTPRWRSDLPTVGPVEPRYRAQRGHLLGDLFGGRGTDPRNLAWMHERINLSTFKVEFENPVRAALERGESVSFSVQPQYRPGEAAPYAIEVWARSSSGETMVPPKSILTPGLSDVPLPVAPPPRMLE